MSAQGSGPGDRRAVLVDVALAVLVAAAVSVAISAKVEPDARDPDAFAFAFAVAVGALLLFRRRWPAGVLAATVALWFCYYSLGYPAVGVGVPIAGALYAAAEQGRLRIAVVVAAIVLVVSTVYRAYDGQSVTRLLGFDGAENLVLLVAVIALGDSVRSRRELRQRAAEEAAEAAREHQRQAREQLEQERLRIARDLHDVLAHAVSAISIQSQVAIEALPEDPEDARSALDSIRHVSGTALAEMRRTVGVLRGSGQGSVDAAPRAPVGGLADLDRLVQVARDSGLQVTVRRSGDPVAVPIAVDAAAHRIAQESLTNVLRHAPAAAVTVDVDVRPGRLELTITDSGAGPGPAPDAHGRNGFGQTGMRERAKLLGGAVDAGPTADGGYRVRAVLPLGGGSIGHAAGSARAPGEGAGAAAGAPADPTTGPQPASGFAAAVSPTRPAGVRRP